MIGPRINSLNLFNLIDNLKLNRINSIHLTPEIFNSLNKIYENRNFNKEEIKKHTVYFNGVIFMKKLEKTLTRNLEQEF